MTESTFNFTVPDTSPMITYAPYVGADATTGGWASVCPTYVTDSGGQNSYICDPNSAHTTSSFKASVRFNFEGVGIYLVGNTTNSLGYDISLDGVQFPGNPKPDSQTLYSATGLKPGAHSITLTVRQPASTASPGSVTFKEAIVVAGTGLMGATVTKNVVDDGDPNIIYDYPSGGNWTTGYTYPQSTGPPGSTTFHESYWTNATATLNFQGTAVLAYGACYSHSRFAAYSASVDDAAETLLDGTVNLYSTGGDVKQRSGNCLRYFKTGLDPAQSHKLVLRVKDAGRVAVDWIEVYSVSGGSATNNNHQGGSGSSSSSSSMAGILAGAISGGIVLVLALLALAIFIRRRKHTTDHVEPEKNYTKPQGPPGGYVVTPYQPAPQVHSPVPVQPLHTPPVVPPWPQPQTPAPTVMGAGGAMGMMGAGNRLSIASSGVPLISPGLASTYSASSGPGWSPGPGSVYSNRPSSMENPGYTTPSMPSAMNMAAVGSGSNMAVEGGASSSLFDAASSIRQGMMSPGPPAYDQMSFVAPTPAPSGKHQNQ